MFLVYNNLDNFVAGLNVVFYELDYLEGEFICSTVLAVGLL
jgi:hypothetical protein